MGRSERRATDIRELERGMKITERDFNHAGMKVCYYCKRVIEFEEKYGEGYGGEFICAYCLPEYRKSIGLS